MLALPMLEEIQKTIKSIGTGKAPDDDIPIEVLFHGAIKLAIIHIIINICQGASIHQD